VLRKTAVALFVLVLAGCGSHGVAPLDREWAANARGVAQQLRGDMVAVSGLDRPRVARRALHDDSQLYGLLVSYTDFEGCRHMVAALGVEPAHLRAVQRLLDRACDELHAADALFTRAVQDEDPALLVRATIVGLRALPLLDRAQLALHRQ
jgi:hypothetical protein